MSSINGRQLSYGVLHYGIHTAETGQLGPRLGIVGDQAMKPVKSLVVDEPFIMVTVEVKGRSHVLPVPITSFTHMVLLPEDNKPKNA